MKRRLWPVAALVHWLISFFTDPLVLTCERNLKYGLWKAAFLLFLLVVYGFAGYLLREVSGNTLGVSPYAQKACANQSSQAVRKMLLLSGIYALVMLCFLLLTWPGIWRMDEYTILMHARNLHVHFWQGYLTSVYYIFALMMVPTPAFIVYMQCLIAAGVVGYLVYKLWIYTGKRRIAYLLYVPFFFLPVIDSNLYPMRMSIYAFLELLLLAKLCFWSYERRMPGKAELFGTLLLGGVVTCWRTESIYYLLLFPVLLGVCLWRLASKKQVKQAVLLFLVFGILLVGIQKVGEGKERGERYELTALIRPLVPLLVEAAYEEEQDLVKTIDQVVNCAYIFEGASLGMNGIEIFWGYLEQGLMRDTYTPEEYREFQAAFLKLVLRHPKIFIRERMEVYLNSSKLLGRITDQDPPAPPLNKNLRYQTYALLELRSLKDCHTQGRAAAFCYSSILPFLFLASGGLLFVWKKKWVYAGSAWMAALKVPLILLTAPEPLFMYYYSVYLCGWVLPFMAVILFVNKRKEAAVQ
ncbi:MAG: hypothetical protein HFI29_03845 [Lachnospiraceae bacterium]|jgi:hypothetical protein|nr:hypothetical protein [Lachnospiraceae bacterium]